MSSSSPAPDLLLRVTPPRVPRQLLTRSALQMAAPRLRERPGLLVQAPAGYGKTSLLAQWRLELIAHGSAVAWLSAQSRDDEQRLLQGLTLAVRLGASRPGFGQQWQDQIVAPTDALEGVTRWLAELAQAALDLVLIVDEADRLPPASRALLTYLLRNQPPNLRIVIAARSDCELDVDDLLSYGHLLRLGPLELRFGLGEALELSRKLLGPALDHDMVARLHELCEGWPLGLQLLLSAIANGADARAALSSLPGTGLREQLLDLLLSKLDAEDQRFLEDGSIVDHLHPALCQALSGWPDAAERLARLSRDTPLLASAEQGEWLRLHALARERLRQRVSARPPPEQAALHARAAAWLAQHGQLEAAARQAWEAGEREQALDLAERSLYETLTRDGRQSAVREWLERLPPQAVEHRPRLQLAAAWTLALSERHVEAGRLVEGLLARPGVDAALRCECALVLSGAAVFADLPDRFAALHDPWDQQPPLQDPLLLQVHANRSAFRRLLAGEPALARLRLQNQAGASGYIAHWSDLIAAMSQLWEGQVAAADTQLRAALHRAEAELGRRSPFASMLAALLAATLWEQDHGTEAQALLANRLDVLERSALPEAVLLGFRTLARISSAEGSEPRALSLLAALDAVGQARALPRLRIASLAEQVRLHARRHRAETCRALLVDLDSLLADPALPSKAESPLWWRGVDMLAALARGHAAIAASDWRCAVLALGEAVEGAQRLHLGRFRIEAQGLKAYALDRCGERAGRALIAETRDLAEAMGLRRVFADAHPALGDWVHELARPHEAVAAQPAAPAPAPQPVASRLPPSMALTPKEREVLDLLARNLSNKEIALALQVGEETIKWHVKNLFAKLDAGTRKQVVARARILGLLPPQE
ncbi:LuxR C-terminal-related transcriptional regulator [Pelomonas sp. SE-A7]|uniref:helix-turn-helix transcriptional regulator n=1 Tax=Pelomonas sp. SE-A7 TaxID=3054953 RepID=UPI00259C77E2|nr:LuxR C-terminal-related transcriptional regulator [Pelomonas sp. SE-A7]MDM4764469.1 LuxR C-terminal-related transcriptional regulator [Pelomonas sp. SE-A7]